MAAFADLASMPSFATIKHDMKTVKADTVLLLLCGVTATMETPMNVDPGSSQGTVNPTGLAPFSSVVLTPLPRHVGEASIDTSKTTATGQQDSLATHNPKHVKSGSTPYTVLRNMSLADLVLQRPHRARDSEGRRFTTAFNQHPEIKKLNPKTLTSQQYELAFRKLRGERKDAIYTRKWTHALKRCLRDQDAPKSYIDRVLYHWKSYSEPPTQLKWARKRRNEMKLTTNPNLIQKMKSNREKSRIRSQERREEMKIGKLGIREQNTEKALGKLVNTKIPTGLDMTSMEEYLRPVLDDEPDEKANNEALQLFLEPVFGTQFAQGVVAFRRIDRRRASMKRSQEKLQKFKMEKSRLAVTRSPNVTTLSLHAPSSSSNQSESLDENKGGSERWQRKDAQDGSSSPPAPAKVTHGLNPQRDLAAGSLLTDFSLDDRWWDGWYT